MSANRKKRPHGQVRQGQVVTTYGPGSMTDLEKLSVLMGGLDYWLGEMVEIPEPRLQAKVAKVLGKAGVRLQSPPAAERDEDGATSGVPSFIFPEWYLTQDALQDGEAARQRRLVPRRVLTKGKYVDDGKKKSVVPVRFVRACRKGHIGDLDWYEFVHGGKSNCASQGRALHMEERGTSGDLGETWAACDCGAARPMSQAADLSSRALGLCDGARPWLGPSMKEKCAEPNRLLVRSASNSYFPQTMGVISLPERNETVANAVTAVWDWLSDVEDIEEVARMRRKPKVQPALEGISDEEVWAEVEGRRSGTDTASKSVKAAELETLLAAKELLGEDRPEGRFAARLWPRTEWAQPWMEGIERVVLVERLREVVALVGFTRFESAAPDIEGELDMGVRRAELSRDCDWVPAIENKGEGIFLQFRTSEIQKWMLRPAVVARRAALEGGFVKWKEEHPGMDRKFPKADYLMLHSFSHLLVTALALECGYPATSIRERVYAIDGVGYGVLLYTASSDAEGTLGGLVQAGRRIALLVRSALEAGTLCSNDPVCAQHAPTSEHERRYLHGAACHGCVLIAETSCEQQNDFLDRALVVRTVDTPDAAFFPGV
ncbi:MAG: DUF1998 domain-containing protein [Bryobacterales bacterium]|nr:DUF1998 domain-containing protein [Bryobacterales bacterium]